MNDEKKRILEMLAQGKVTVDEAERLLKALDESTPVEPASEASVEAGSIRRKPRYLCVKVDSGGSNGGTGSGDKIDVRIPLGLVKAGIKLSSIMPEKAKARMNEKLSEQGIDIDLDNIKGRDLDEVLACLCDANIDIKGDKDTVRIYCE
ncbi:MAG: hypothetical protein R3F07_15900 [Opitutaceae bacterium]